MEKRVQQDLQELKNYEHILDLKQINQSTFQIVYAPSETNSVYKDQKYILQLSIPHDYPQSPPSLHFLTKIYHLNVCPNTLSLKMNILQDQWSPFLSLTSVIQSLDSILEHPEQSSSANSTVLAEYKNSRQKYLQKVLNCVQVEANSPTNEVLNTNEVNDKRDMGLQTTEQEDSRKKIDLGQNPEPQQLKVKSKQIKMEQVTKLVSPIKKVSEKTRYENSPIIQIPDSTFRVENETVRGTISKSLGIFIQQINQNQQQILLTQNQMLKSLLADNLKKQINMVKQLLNISTEAKRNMIKSVRQSKYM